MKLDDTTILQAHAPTSDVSVEAMATKVLNVFEYFSKRHGPATSNEIESALGVSAELTKALLDHLVGTGYLSTDPATRTFVPTVRVGKFGRSERSGY